MRTEGLPDNRSALILIPDTWDDFGYDLMLAVRLLHGGRLTHIGRARFLFPGVSQVHSIFDNFPIDPRTRFARFNPKGLDFISLGSTLDYYKRLMRTAGRAVARDALDTINDVTLLIAAGADVSEFQIDPAWETSLLRSLSERQALDLAASVILGTPRPSKNAAFTLHMALDGFELEHEVRLDFTERLFPGDINALIGLNGVGKTQALVHLVDYLLHLNRYKKRVNLGKQTLLPEPRFRKVIALSLSPYSIFPPTAKVPERKRTEYANIGFHTDDGRLSLSALKRQRLDWLRRILTDDEQESIDDWRRVPVIFKILRRLNLDGIGVRYQDDDGTTKIRTLNEDGLYAINENPRRALTNGKRRKLLFYRGSDEVKLSSGQEQLFLMVLALLAELERESVVVIDEPELYLHPNLEIEFVGLLQDLLDRFESFAVIATHSNTIVRELPNTCVRVFRFGDGGLPLITEPDFQTFGADISELANRIFDNVYVRQPFVEWLIRIFGDEPYRQVRREYGSRLNEESLAILYAHENSQRHKTEP